MADRDRLDAKGAELHRVPHPHLAQVRFAQDAVLFQLEQSERQPRAVDGDVQLFQRERQAADVVFVAVREEDPEHLTAAVQQVGDVRQDEVDAKHVLLREHEPGVDHDNLALPLQRPHIDADLAEAAEREIPEPGAHKSRSCSDSCCGAATTTGGGGGASTWSRYRFTRSKSCSRSATSEPLCRAAAG